MAMGTTVTECTCQRDPYKGAHSVRGCKLHDPALISISIADAGRAAKVEAELLPRVRTCLNKWAARYAESDHAKASVKETRLLIQEIDEVILRR